MLSQANSQTFQGLIEANKAKRYARPIFTLVRWPGNAAVSDGFPRHLGESAMRTRIRLCDSAWQKNHSL